MRIWFQFMASERRSAGLMRAVQEYLDGVVGPDTEIVVHGTEHGGLANQYGVFFHHDEREIIENGVRAQRSGFDAFAIGSSLDPAVTVLRELLDIPVLSQLEVACSVAGMTGERFGIVGTNDKFAARYRTLVRNYGLTQRLAGVDSVQFDDVPQLHQGFTDPTVASAVSTAYARAAQRLVAVGADTIIGAGVHSAIAAKSGFRSLDGALVQDSYALLARFAETAVAMHQLTGQWSSRRSLYSQPSPEVLSAGYEEHGDGFLH